MPKVFENLKKNCVQSEEILRLINKADSLTDGDYELYDINSDSLERILDRILVAAKQGKEWYCYFFTLHKMLYLLIRGDKCKKILKYAEIFYRDSELYMDSAVLNYPDTDIGEYNTCCYSMIFSCYRKFPQITDEKMEAFIERYHESIKKYGDDIYYYQDKLKLALMYKDTEAAKLAKEGLEKCEIESCYLCIMKPVLGYYLLCEDYESLEHMIFEFRTRAIPAKHRWCYKYCHMAEDEELIAEVLDYCLMIGRSEYFRKLLEKEKKLFQSKDEDTYTSKYYIYACLGDWSFLQRAVERAKDDIENWKKGEQSALGYMYDCLCWYCYFTKLDSCGTHEVVTELAGKEVPEIEESECAVTRSETLQCEMPEESEMLGTAEPDKEVPKEGTGKCACLELAAYFEREADKIGAQMEASRKRYDYSALKQSYRDCMDMA